MIELWPLFHYVLWDHATDGQTEAQNYRHYVTANEKFAQVIYECYQNGDTGLMD